MNTFDMFVQCEEVYDYDISEIMDEINRETAENIKAEVKEFATVL